MPVTSSHQASSSCSGSHLQANVTLQVGDTWRCDPAHQLSGGADAVTEVPAATLPRGGENWICGGKDKVTESEELMEEEVKIEAVYVKKEDIE